MSASVSVIEPIAFGESFIPVVTLPRGKTPDGGYWVKAMREQGGFAAFSRVGNPLSTGVTPSWDGLAPATIRLQLFRIDNGVLRNVSGATCTFDLAY